MFHGDSFKLDAADLDVIAAYKGESRKNTDSIWWYAQRYCNSAYTIALAAINRSRTSNGKDKR